MVARAIVLALSLSSIVHAQDRDRARALFEQGVALSSQERWAEALEAFEQSRAIVERPSTVFNIATALQRLGRAREAIAAAEVYLTLAHPRRDAEQIAGARMLIDVLRSTLATVELRVVPAEAEIEIDGRTEPGEGTERSLTLDPGEHHIVVSAPGYAPHREDVDLRSSERRALSVALERPRSVIAVRSTVASAIVLVDGRAAEGSVELAPGAHRVEVRADGYEPLDRRVELAPGQHLTIDAALVRRPTELASEPWLWILLGTAAAGIAAVIAGVALSLPQDVFEGTAGFTLFALEAR